MADEESQVQEDTSWWAFDGFADPELPSMSIDEPLEWPDSLPWEEYSSGVAPAPPPAPVDLVFPLDAGSEYATDVPPPPMDEPGLDWPPGADPDATVATPLAGLGGGGPASVHALPESIWSTNGGGDHDDQVAGLASLAAPLVYADTDGKGRGKRPRRFDVKRGNIAVVALISAVSLVLLGMFLSVRSRNDLPTDATASPPRTDQIATANTRNTVPSTTAVVSTTVPAPAINIADLVPEDAATGAGTGTAGGSGGSGGTSSATTAPRSSAAPAGGTSTATTQPAPQATATTAPPDTAPPETTTPTAPPATDDTPNTTRPRTSTSISLPNFPTIPDFPNNGGTSPTLPNFPSFPNF